MSLVLRHVPGGEPPPAGLDLPRSLRAAMLESRQRWQDFALLGHDLLFETDAEGRFAFLAPAAPLGHPAAALLGQPAATLVEGTTLLARRQALRDHPVRLRAADGSLRLFLFSVVPLLDDAGGFAGLRGAGRDVTEPDAVAAEAAALARRHALLARLTLPVRHEFNREDAAERALRRLARALGCAGAAILGTWSRRRPLPVVQLGHLPHAGLLAGVPRCPNALLATRAGARPLAIVPLRRGAQGRMALVLWRAPAARDFDADDAAVLDIYGGILAEMLTHRALNDMARRDGLTGLLNRRAFLADLRRRLARGQRAGALFYVDIDDLKPINDRDGHAAGDCAIRALAGVLQASLRPVDLVGRLGGDEFALWCDAMQPAEASACAERILRVLRDSAAGLGCSIGIAPRPAGVPVSLTALIARADAALYAAKQAGRGRWRMALT